MDVSEEHIVSICRFEEEAKQETSSKQSSVLAEIMRLCRNRRELANPSIPIGHL
jgi:hypothetical protein